MSQQQALYRLQKIDTELDARRARLRKINVLLEGNTELRAARSAVEALKNDLAPHEAHVKDMTLENQSVISQASELSARLYGGEVSNPKELQEMEDKIAELKRRRSQLETDLLEEMMVVEELQSSLAAASDTLSAAEAAWSGDQTSLREEQKRVKKEGRALKADRETALAAVDPENQALYEELRTQRQGIAVALLKGDTCTGCWVDQTANVVQEVRRGKGIVTCTSCGRILVTP
ncbi:MAG TPA: C4-type zinc ribbon domain-containing protein [Aggregatilinea sp.]|jgi:predicted  nucleic acid-binding Zn-ribbon protein|uniref:zinc ribbon domain-containing protein n=1 Tax=Aggregatilinea sp. TaxID=2806333 RepID=UPI002C4632AC|nr:C4-type zinc ribbon domain-containing protein [Aggregatilinea sp.]HML21041.1 C4-type zinc ribbon domain-containing protein [Aggregatilinea sp.]